MPSQRLAAPFALAACALAAGGLAACRADRPAVPAPAPAPAAAPADTVYTTGPATADGTGRFYLGREIAQVMGHEGAGWLDRPDRAVTELPDRVLDALGLTPASVVADIGAGTGYFTFRIAPRVPQGRVLAVDIEPEMLALVRDRMRRERVANVVPVLSTEADPNLPADSIDVALIVDAYHEFAYPREMAAAVRAALRPGGRLVLVEYRAEDPTVAIKPLHKMTVAQVEREMAAVGLRLRDRLDVLPQQHLLVFERADAPAR